MGVQVLGAVLRGGCTAFIFLANVKVSANLNISSSPPSGCCFHAEKVKIRHGVGFQGANLASGVWLSQRHACMDKVGTQTRCLRGRFAPPVLCRFQGSRVSPCFTKKVVLFQCSLIHCKGSFFTASSRLHYSKPRRMKRAGVACLIIN